MINLRQLNKKESTRTVLETSNSDYSQMLKKNIFCLNVSSMEM